MNASVLYAFMVLASFYSAFKFKLKPFKPVGKFLCIKFIIFVVFWQVIQAQAKVISPSPLLLPLTFEITSSTCLLQGVAIAGLVKLNVIKDIGNYQYQLTTPYTC